MKNILLLIAAAVGMTSCSKLEELTPQPIPEEDVKYEIHVSYKNSEAIINLNGSIHFIGGFNVQGTKVIVSKNIKGASFLRTYGKTTNVTIYKGFNKVQLGNIDKAILLEW